MTSHRFTKLAAILQCSALLFLGAPPISTSAQDQSSQPASTDQSNSSQSSNPSAFSAAAAPLTTDQLDSLVAPIALYPDALVAQIFAASAFPDEIAIADYWLGQNKALSSTDLAAAVNQQTWDPSVKALCQFPSVLDDLAKNLAWTSSLGQAFESQQADVMTAVQAMRAKAQAAGNLQSNQQISVVQQTPQTIVIKPANPQIVYVPVYNPTIVYGTPYVVPLYTPPPAAVAIAAGIGFGAGIAIGAAIGGGGGFVYGGGWGGFGWGFNTWNCGWGGGGGNVIIHNNNTYITNNNFNHTTYNNYHP
jgi:hypothetical protein